MKRILIGAVTLLVAGTMTVRAQEQVSHGQADRIRASADALADVRGEPDKDIPQDLWDKAQCVVVIPSLKKAAFVFGGEYGKGMMSCRANGEFGAPVFMELEKGSWGFQIGGESIDLVLLVMNPSGMKKMLGDKTSLGADVSLAAGPVGRNAAASTDARMNAEVLSYSRAQGLFAGIDVSGGVLRPDVDANHELYGHDVSAPQILTDGRQAPEATRPFMAALRRGHRTGK
jgi:lipid-binding SYLF domain-containing protein